MDRKEESLFSLSIWLLNSIDVCRIKGEKTMRFVIAAIITALILGGMSLLARKNAQNSKTPDVIRVPSYYFGIGVGCWVVAAAAVVLSAIFMQPGMWWLYLIPVFFLAVGSLLLLFHKRWKVVLKEDTFVRYKVFGDPAEYAYKDVRLVERNQNAILLRM